MNHSSYSTDRGTHLKMRVVALAVAIAMASLVSMLSNIDTFGRDRGG